MNAKLVELATATAQAAALQGSALQKTSMAVQAQATATSEQAQAAALQEQAVVLLEKAQADAALAAGEQVQAQELKVQVLAEQEESAAHAAAAAVEETTAEEEMAQATADAVQAARSEAQARGEEVGIGVCEFVPFLDIACDIIGSITAVGMEGLAASQALKASGEVAAATAAQAEEEREVAWTADLQAKAAQDEAAAAELQAQQAEQAELADEERIAGEEKEAEADALLEQAEAEEETAAEQEAMAAEQEEEAAALAASALTKGVLSLWDAIMASVFGAMAFAFFAFKFTARILPPAVSTIAGMWSAPSASMINAASTASFARNLSYNLHHCGIFALIAGSFSNLFHVFEQSSLQARGGIIIAFAVAGACTQTILLHSIPRHLSKSETLFAVALYSLRCVLSLWLLYGLEILIVWAAFGSKVFATEWLAALDNWQWWVLFLLPLGLHWWFLEVPMLQRHTREPDNDSTASSDEWDSDEWVKLPATETDALLPTKHVEVGSRARAESTASTRDYWLALLWQDLSKMHVAFEMLLLTCMTGLLIHCLGAARTLWPASKALLLSTRPDWLIPLGIAAAVVGVVGLIVSILVCRRRNDSRWRNVYDCSFN